MLPWIKLSTGLVLNEREERMRRGREASVVDALAELASLYATHRLHLLTQRGLADSWRWSPGRLRRQLVTWERGGALLFLGGEPLTNPDLPGWWTTVFERSQDLADTREPLANHSRTTDEPPRARSTLEREIETEIERDIGEREPVPEALSGDPSPDPDLPPPDPTPDPDPTPSSYPYPVASGYEPPLWVGEVWPLVLAATGRETSGPRAPVLTPARGRMLTSAKKIAGDRDALEGYLRGVATLPAFKWMRDGVASGHGSVETPIKPGKMQVYLETWRGSQGSRPPEVVLDLAPVAERLLWAAVRAHGQSDPPRVRVNGGGAEVRWTWEAPPGVDPGRWDEAAAAALEGAGGWRAVVMAPERDRPFVGRRFGAAVVETYQQRRSA